MFFLILDGCRLSHKEKINRPIDNPIDLITFLKDTKTDTLVCGGINRETRGSVSSLGVDIVDNVACSIAEVIDALKRGAMRSGYGLFGGDLQSVIKSDEANLRHFSTQSTAQNTQGSTERPFGANQLTDCLACRDKVCLLGRPCRLSVVAPHEPKDGRVERILESAADISFETERVLCRVAELVYFCLEMKYGRIGIAFCLDLLEQTGVLAGVLRRFFDVRAVCCKVGGNDYSMGPSAGTSGLGEFGSEPAPCNPLAQAEILNQFDSQLNIIVGLCVGVDCVFTEASRAPVTTLFVKDKMLANNPIGAMYSDYYLAEIARQKAET